MSFVAHVYLFTRLHLYPILQLDLCSMGVVDNRQHSSSSLRCQTYVVFLQILVHWPFYRYILLQSLYTNHWISNLQRIVGHWYKLRKRLRHFEVCKYPSFTQLGVITSFRLYFEFLFVIRTLRFLIRSFRLVFLNWQRKIH